MGKCWRMNYIVSVRGEGALKGPGNRYFSGESSA